MSLSFAYVQVLKKIWDLKEKNEVEDVLCNYANGSAWGCWVWMTMKGYGRKKKEEFWRNKQNGDFLEKKKFLKRDFLPFSTNIYFWEKRFKGDFSQRPIYGEKKI